MSLSTGIQDLKKAVKRLEAAAGKGQRYCPYCRYVQRHSWPDSKKMKPHPEDVIKATCEFCRSEYEISIANKPEEEREAVRLHFSFTLEDFYTNPKAYALGLWRKFRPQRKKRRNHLAKAKERLKKDSKVHASDKLVEEVRELFAQKHKRLKAKYGDSPFPEQIQLVESVRNTASNKRDTGIYVKGLFELELEETGYLICAELEKIIWGQTRATTKAAIEKIEREIDDLIRTTKETEERRQEERRLKDQEFLNRNRASVGLPPLPT